VNFSATLLGKHGVKMKGSSEEPSKKKLKRENNEETYESAPREARWKDEEEKEYLLPIKTGRSIIHRVKAKQPTTDDDDEDNGINV